jgi:hypothetical protein
MVQGEITNNKTDVIKHTRCDSVLNRGKIPLLQFEEESMLSQGLLTGFNLVR